MRFTKKTAVFTAMFVLVILSAARAAEYIWMEGEDYTSSTFNNDSWYRNDPVNKDLLSPGVPGDAMTPRGPHNRLPTMQFQYSVRTKAAPRTGASADHSAHAPALRRHRHRPRSSAIAADVANGNARTAAGGLVR